MKCLGIHEMAAFLDGMTDSRERAHAEEHFRQCAACREAKDELAAMLCLPPVEAGQDVVDAGKSLVSSIGVRAEACRPSSHSPGLAAVIRPRWAQ